MESPPPGGFAPGTPRSAELRLRLSGAGLPEEKRRIYRTDGTHPSNVARPEAGQELRRPDLTGRDGSGFALVYTEKRAGFDRCWFTRRSYDSVWWTDEVTYNDHNVDVSALNCIESIPPGAGTGHDHGMVYLPASDSPYFDRIDYPFVDIKCNGEDTSVIVPSGTPVELTVDVIVAEVTPNVDLWFLVKTPFPYPFPNNWFSYDAAGPYFGWWLGSFRAFRTGPAESMHVIPLSSPLPAGTYSGKVLMERPANGVIQPAGALASDSVDFTVS